jgi:hypothetical protein
VTRPKDSVLMSMENSEPDLLMSWSMDMLLFDLLDGDFRGRIAESSLSLYENRKQFMLVLVLGVR